VTWPILGGFSGALMTVASVTLFIACANVASLMLGRGRTRAREIAVRLAIGANRRRLGQLLLVECLVIAFASGILDVAVAGLTAGMVTTLESAADIAIHLDARIDERVLWFTVVVSGVSALLFGLFPALQSTRTDLADVMKAGETDRADKEFFGRYTLVVAQI